MKTKSFIAGILLIAAAVGHAATNDLTSALQKGLFEEEANHNLDAAVQAYQTVSAQFDKDRKLAATAIFRLGEVYRKQGKTNEATAQYERIVREFSDQQTLVTLSRQNLAGIGAKGDSPVSPLTRTARLEQKKLLDEEIKLVEQDLADLKKQLANGVVPQSEVRAKEREVLKLRQQVAALNVDAEEVAPGTSAATPVTDEEEKEIRRIQVMIQNSPDLINAPDAAGTLPLIAAASRGQLRVAQFLLDSGAGVNRAVANGVTALHAAAENGHKAMLELLTQHKADLEARENHGYTPLHLAASKGFQGVAETLVAAKADVNARSKTQATPLHLTAAIGQGALTAFLIAKGADVEAKDNSGATPLIIAASRGNEGLVTALLAAKADPNIIDAGGRTALSFAAGNGQADMVKALLDSKADPNAGTSTLPLAAACNRDGTNIAYLLLRAGADPNRGAPVNFDVSFLGRTFGGGSTKLTPLHITVANARADLAKLFLQFKADPKARRPASDTLLIWETFGNAEFLKAFLDAGADPNADNGDVSATLLYMAASVGNAAGVEALLAAGARVNPPPDSRDTPLHIAVQKGHEKTIHLLLEAGAEVNRRNRDGLTPLWKAVLNRKTDIAGLLLAHGADPNLTVDNGTTPLHFAANQEDRSLVRLLLTNKAEINVRDRNGKTPLDFAKEKLARSGPSAIGTPIGIGTLLPPPSSSLPNNSDAQPQSPAALADLLREHGARDDLPKLDRIEVRRPGVSAIAFPISTNGWNEFSLLELLAQHYGFLTTERNAVWEVNKPTEPSQFWGTAACQFPDFGRVIIRRPDRSGPRWTEIPVNAAALLDSGDCTRDLRLHPGDIVEIPEADHPVNEKWAGFPELQLTNLLNCVERTITISIKGTPTQVKLSPAFKLTNRYGSYGARMVDVPRGSFMLKSVLAQSRLLRASSDVSQVRVTRRVADKTQEWVLNCGSGNDPDLWLRDGDVIEVPDKP